MMSTAICWLIIISSAMLVLGKNCTDVLQYHHEDNTCQPCHGCKKGTGINLTEKTEYSDPDKFKCYSCKTCPEGTYQDDEFALKSCEQCGTCPNRQISRNCSNTENIICGDCLPGYFVQANKEIIVCDTKSSGNCDETLPWILFGIAFLIIIIILAYFLYKKGLIREAFTFIQCAARDLCNSLQATCHPNTQDVELGPNVPVEPSNNESPLTGDSGNNSEVNLPEAKSENPNDGESSTAPEEPSNKDPLLPVASGYNSDNLQRRSSSETNF